MACFEECVDSTCHVCGGIYDSEAKLMHHMKIHFDHVNSCPFCPYSSLDTSELQIHVATVHVEEMKTPTKHTSSVANDGSKYMKGQESYEACPVCDASFPNTSISMHVETHFLDDNQPNGSRAAFTKTNHLKKTKSCWQDFSTEATTDDAAPSCSHQVISSDYTDSDRILAQQLEKEEIRQMHEEKLGRQVAEEVQLEMLKEEQHFNPGGNYISQAVKSMEKDVGRKKLSITEYYVKKFDLLENLDTGVDDASTCTIDVCSRLADKLQRYKPLDLHWVLCAHGSHFGRDYGDTGWGCGYRNIQMMLTSLQCLPIFQDHLTSLRGSIPSIPKLQRMIETAWSNGFDASGRAQLENKLVGTRKWIGSTEVFTVLSSLGFHCRIVDFHRFSDMKSRRHLLLFDWLAGYFQSRESTNQVHREKLPPVYLQHAGHSRTIFGVEYNDKCTRPSRVVLFDPSHQRREVESALVSKKVNSSSLFLKPLSSFIKPQYQVVCVVGIASSERYEVQKNVDRLAERMPL